MINSNLIISGLRSMRSESGGFRNGFASTADPLTTAQVLILLRNSPDLLQSLQSSTDSAIGYLESTMGTDGHWERSDDSWHSSITAWCVTALCMWGRGHSKAVARAVQWLSSRVMHDGGVAESETILQPNTYSTASAVLAFSSFGLPESTYRKSLNWLQGRQGKNGGYSDRCVVQRTEEASISAYVWHALEKLENPIAAEIRRGCESFLASVQRASGAWTTWFEDADTIEGTAAALRVLIGSGDSHRELVVHGLSFIANQTVDDSSWWIWVSVGYLIKDLKVSI